MALLGGADAAASVAIAAQIQTLAAAPAAMFFVSVFERMLAMILHISLSVWVFCAAKEKKKLWLYPAAIIMHAAVDFPAALYQKGVMSIWAVYLFMIAFDVLAAVIAARLFKSIGRTQNK